MLTAAYADTEFENILEKTIQRHILFVPSFAFSCQNKSAQIWLLHHLQVADGWCAVDLHVGSVGTWQLEAISEPNH